MATCWLPSSDMEEYSTGSWQWWVDSWGYVKKEIQIRQSEVIAPQNHTHPTASFLTAAGKTLKPPRQIEPVKKQSCVFCKGPHVPIECTVVTTPDQRREAIRDQKLCFNCLGRHKVSLVIDVVSVKESICSTTELLPRNSRESSNTSNGTTTVNTSNVTASTTQSLQITEVGTHLVTVPNVPPTTSSLHSTGSNTCLLKTAVDNILANGYCMAANILFNEGSQR